MLGAHRHVQNAHVQCTSSGTPANSINNNTINNIIFVIVLKPWRHGTPEVHTTHFPFLSLGTRGRSDVLDICLGVEKRVVELFRN